MADYLLGNQAYMESLQQDVQDVQWAVTDILSRTGPMSSPSWKFPDKQAGDVDIDDLLDLYHCSEDDDMEDKQVAHIALYELLIDRLVFLIRSVTTFVNSQIRFGEIKHKDPLDGVGSAGPIMKHFWSQMISVQTHFKQLLSENKSYSTKLSENKASKCDNAALDKDMGEASLPRNTAASDILRTPGILGVIPPNTADLVLMGMSSERSEDSQPYSISRDTNNKSCQTYETAFVPCESCDVVQRKMKEAGEIVIKICTEQGLPCSLKKYKSQIAHVEWMSFNDVCRWMVEQNKDIARVGKQNELLQSTINPMKSEVKSCQRRTSAAEEKAKLCENNLKEEKETQSVLRRQIENKMKEQEKKHAEELSEEERQREKLRKAKEKLETEMGGVKVQLEEQMQTLKTLESDHRRMKQELEIKNKEAERSSSLSTEVADLRVHLSEITTKLDESTKLLAREQGKNRNASKHTESLQSKQDSLLSRMEYLGKENEDLGSQVVSLEEEKIQLEDSMAELKVEAKELRQKARENEVVIKNLMNQKEDLDAAMKKADASIQELEKSLEAGKGRERMIVEYPDLNGPVNPNLQGTGDIVVDMGNQVTANTIRIKLLEEQNYSLTQSISKVKHMQGTGGRRHDPAPSAPQPLWQQDSSTLAHFHTEPHSSNNNNSNRVIQTPVHEFTREDAGRVSPIPVKQNTWVFGQTRVDENASSKSSPPGHFVVGHSSNPKSHTPNKQGRPPSGKRLPAMVPVNTTSIGAYTEMKRALGVLATKDKNTHRKGKSSSRPSSADRHVITVPGSKDYGRSGSEAQTLPPSAFCCPRCDKTYLKSRDLSIHLSYCTG